jgi:hypothetical protein
MSSFCPLLSHSVYMLRCFLGDLLMVGEVFDNCVTFGRTVQFIIFHFDHSKLWLRGVERGEGGEKSILLFLLKLVRS